MRASVKWQPLKVLFWKSAHVIVSATSIGVQMLVQIGSLEISLIDLSVLFLFLSNEHPTRTAGPIFTLYYSNDVFQRKEAGPLRGL